jgi:hypothetical protein
MEGAEKMNFEKRNINLDSHWKITEAPETQEIIIKPACTDCDLRILINELDSLVNIGKGFASVTDTDCFFGNVNRRDSRWFVLLYDRTNRRSVFVENRHGGVFHWENDGLHCPDGKELRIISGKDPVQLLQKLDFPSRGPVRKLWGWNSWDYYYDTITEEDVIENIQAIQKDPILKANLDYIVIDDGWESMPGDWIPNHRFHGDLSRVVKAITDVGMIPGIWTAPFMISSRSPIGRFHAEMLCKKNDGFVHFEPLADYGRVGMPDLRREDARQFIRDTYARLYETGFRFFKLDFINMLTHAPGMSPEMVDLGLNLIRESIGEDAVLLGCGMTPGCGIGTCDTMRVIPDISTYWSCILVAARALSAYWFLHGKVCTNDPDFLIVRNRKTSLDEHFNPYHSFIPYQSFVTRGGTPIDSIHEVQVGASLIILSGGNIMLGDRISRLNSIGMDIVHTVLKYNSGETAIPYDLGGIGIPEQWENSKLYAVFNFYDTTRTITLKKEVVGFEVWQKKEITIAGSLTLPPRSVLLVEKE